MSVFQFPSVDPNSSVVDFIANTLMHVSPLNGAIQTDDRGGERLGLQINTQNLSGADRRKLMKMIANLNGQQHRFVCRDHSYVKPSGTLSTVAELFPELNATNFINTAAWLSAINLEEGIRLAREGDDVNDAHIYNTPTGLTVGVSYAVRNAIMANTSRQARGHGVYITSSSGGNPIFNLAEADFTTDIYTLAFTAPATSLRVGCTDEDLAARHNSHFDWTHASLSRCLLVDNGVNQLTRSEELDTADWTKAGSTISANAVAGPDGETTADELVEDSSTGVHDVRQSVTKTAARQFWTLTAFLKANTRTDVRLRFQSSSDAADCAFDLSAGAHGSVAEAGDFDHGFASIHDYGNGWYRCRLTVQTDDDASLTAIVRLLSGGSSSYTGDGSSGAYVVGVQLQQGGQLGRYVSTTTAAATPDSQTSDEIFVKGLDTSVDGQVLAGDQIEIGGRLCTLKANLDGDASGCGLAIIGPRLTTAPSDEEPVILFHPQGKFLLADNSVARANRPGVFSDVPINAIEDIAA